jgi:hypothetical protein
MYNEAVMNVRSIQDFDTPDGIKTHALKAKIMLNLTDLLLHLPDRVQQISEQIEAKQSKVTSMKSAQEGGSI